MGEGEGQSGGRCPAVSSESVYTQSDHEVNGLPIALVVSIKQLEEAQERGTWSQESGETPSARPYLGCIPTYGTVGHILEQHRARRR